MTSGPAPSRWLFAVLALVTFMGPLSLHLYFPAAPAVMVYFESSEAMIQMTVSAPLFAMAFMTLVFGSLSDRFGRRRVLLLGILMFLAGSVLAALSNSIWMLVGGRLIQASGGACGLALARAIARDIYGTDQLVKVVAYLTMAYSLGPMVAPPIGGLLADSLGWRSVLMFAAVSGALILILVARTINESGPGRSPNERRQSPWADYISLFRDIRFSAFALQAGASTGSFFALASGTAYIMTDYLGRPVAEFGLWFPLMPFGLWLGNFLSSRIGGRVGIETMVFGATGLMLLATSVFAALMMAGLVFPLTLFLPGFLLTFGQGLNTPFVQTGLLKASASLAGTAAGVGVFAQMFGGGLFSQIYGWVSDGTPVPLAATVWSATVVAFLASMIPFILSRWKR
jgi:MFS transporter, DHA1 family, multidrug resistance protein